MRHVVPLLLVVLAFAGCVQDGDKGPAPTATTSTSTSDTQTSTSMTQTAFPYTTEATGWFVHADQRHWLNRTSDESEPPYADTGGHCGAGSWTADPTLRIVHYGTSPHTHQDGYLFVEHESMTDEPQVSIGGRNVARTLSQDEDAAIIGVINTSLVIVTISLEADGAYVDGEPWPVGATAVATASYTHREGTATYHVDERIVLTNFGPTPTEVTTTGTYCY